MNLNYHIYEPDIKCPYCDTIYYDEEYYVSQQLETEVELECDSCGKNFWAESCIVFNTHADCALNDKKHDLEKTCVPNYFGCKNCPHSEHGESIINQ